MTRRGRRRLGTLVVAVLAVGVAAPAGAARDTPSWRAITSTIRAPLDLQSTNSCNRGDHTCVDAVLAEMRRRYQKALARCDHRTMFLFAYMRVTDDVDRQVQQSNVFRDPRYLALFDAVFAKMYFDTVEAYDAVMDDQVAPAWGIALQAAADKRTSAIGDMMLGMNAHITRDLAFVVAAMGTTAPDGSSRKPDFDAINALLVDLQIPMLDAAARRLDPTLAGFQVPTLNLDRHSFAALITAWRNEAWLNGERLASAPTPQARATVAAQIEALAQTRAVAIQAATSYLGIGPSTRERDRFCRAHR